MRILVAEDEKSLSAALCGILEKQKYMTDAVYNGTDAVDYALCNEYDLIILDVMMPGKDGFEVAAELRQSSVATPILMLTAKDAVRDKVRGLDSGADDYMTKPFSPDELLARVRALTRRKGEPVSDEIKFGDITFSNSSFELAKGEKSVRLNFKEAQIMKLLLSRPNMVLSKEEIITKVWGYDSDTADSSVEAYMSFLRRKLEFLKSSVSIISQKKVGYRLEYGEGQ